MLIIPGSDFHQFFGFNGFLKTRFTILQGSSRYRWLKAKMYLPTFGKLV